MIGVTVIQGACDDKHGANDNEPETVAGEPV